MLIYNSRNFKGFLNPFLELLPTNIYNSRNFKGFLNVLLQLLDYHIYNSRNFKGFLNDKSATTFNGYLQ